ncbi:CotH kinase family protein [uncultured Ruminococcus sp.]|uniref:CotH kinase family protein n=1 Tax=uncultured Ruminococcus sp. TaxID=165186 RepID=UPI002627ED2F|nr:CotH kinase family protein [uncultured Ruminococcus sp.]
MYILKKIAAAVCAAASASSLIIAVPSVHAESGGLLINEVCTQNKTSYTDSYGKASDWIELINIGGSDMDMGGYGISDDPASPPAFVFPEGTVLGRGERIVLAASKDPSAEGELHTGFALSKSGETLALYYPDGSLADRVDIPALKEDETYGRIPDGGSTFGKMRPTPGAANAQAVAEPVFSMQSGFYAAQQGLELTLSAEDTIYYTLDSSDPTTSDTAQVYTGAIPMYDRSSDPNVYSRYQHDNTAQSIILSTNYRASSSLFDKVTVVRAAARSADGTFSSVTTNTYFVMPEDKLAYYSDIPVVSMVTDPDNLFDPDKGIYVCGNQFLEWRKNDPRAFRSEWDTTNVANFFSKGRAWERPANITLFENGSLGFSQDMGIRIKGASTRNSQSKSFNVYARSEYGDSKLNYTLLEDNYSADDGKLIKKYDSFSLRAVGWVDRMRELAVNDPLKKLDDLASYDSKRCMLFIDGELWGMYEIMEKCSDYYIQSNYGVPAGNVSIIKNGELEEGPESEYDALLELDEYCMSHDLSNAEAYEYAASRIDVDSMIMHYCAGLYLGTWDWPNYNYLMWKNNGEPIEGNAYSDGKWRFGTFDLDYSAGITYDSFGGVQGYAHDSFRKMDEATADMPSSIFKAMLANEGFRNKFAAMFSAFATNVYEPQKMVDLISEQEQRYMPYMVMMAWRWNSGTPRKDYSGFASDEAAYYSKELGVMKDFFRNRPQYAMKFMREYLGISSDMLYCTVIASEGGSVSCNGSSVSFVDGMWSGGFGRGDKVTLTAVPHNGYEFAGWTGAVNSSEETVTVTMQDTAELRCSFVRKAPVAGDVNLDGAVGVADLVMLQRYIIGAAGLAEADRAQSYDNSDMNGDEEVDSLDVSSLRRKVIGLSGDK